MTLKKKQSSRPKKEKNEKKETNIPVDMNSFLYQLEYYNLTIHDPKHFFTLPSAILYN